MTILHTLYNEKFKSATLIFFCIFLGNINVEAQNAYSFFVAITSRKHLWAFQVVAGRHWAMAWAVADGLVGYEAVIELDTYPSSSILTSGRIFLSLSHQIQLAALPNNHYLHKYQYFLLRTFHSTKKKPEKYVVLFLNALACMYVCTVIPRFIPGTIHH